MKQVHFEEISYDDSTEGKKRVLKFLPNEGEELFLSYSKERQTGPGIIRDGFGPPHMYLNPGEKETNELKQREGSWDIFENSNNNKSHIGEFTKTHPNYEITYVLSFGDLTMNEWNVAFVNNSNNEKELILLRDEPTDKRLYTCFVKWKESKNNVRYSIDTLQFNYNQWQANKHDENNENNENNKNIIELVKENKKRDITDDIEFAIFGQQVLRHDIELDKVQVVDPIHIVHQFSDIRHLLTLPNINSNNKDKEVPIDTVTLEQRYKSKDACIWFGEAELLDKNNLNTRRAALSAPIYLKINFPDTIPVNRYSDSFKKLLADNGYTEIEDNPYKSLIPGEWRFIKENDQIIEIFLKINTYPCSMLGVDKCGNFYSLAWTGKYGNQKLNNDKGWTIKEAAKTLKARGAINAILCDEGQDVMQMKNPLPKELEDYEFKNKREQLRAVLIVAKKNQKLNQLNSDQQKN